MTVLEMLTEIGDKLDDPKGDRFNPTKKLEFLNQAQDRLIILLLVFKRIGLGREDLLGVLSIVSSEVTPDAITGVAAIPDDFFDYRRNKKGEPIIEIGGKRSRRVDADYKDWLVKPGSTHYASEDNPAYYEESGGIIPFPVGSKVIYHYVRKPQSFADLDEDDECELSPILHPILVQDAIKTAAEIDGKANIANDAEGKYHLLIYKLLTGAVSWA